MHLLFFIHFTVKKCNFLKSPLGFQFLKRHRMSANGTGVVLFFEKERKKKSFMGAYIDKNSE